MTAELTTMWQTIHAAMYHIALAKDTTTNPPDGMPGTPSNPRRLPCNEYALSLEEQINRRAAHWTGQPNPIEWLTTNTTNFYNQLGELDQLNFQTETHALWGEAKQFLPQYHLIKRITGKDLEQIHAHTMTELAAWLKVLGNPTSESTLRTWKERGHLDHTPNGYSIHQALERIMP